MPEPDNSGKTRSSHNDNAPSVVADLLVRFRKPLIILAHILVFAASLMLSFLLTSNMQLRREWLFKQFPLLLMFILPLKLIIFTFFKQYQGWWRYVGISDLIGIVRASLISTIIIVALWFGMLNVDIIRRPLYPLTAIAQGVFILDLFCTIMLLGGLRMVVRMYHEEFLSETGSRIKRLLIIGAGDAGEALLREIMRMKVEQYEAIGFIDDDLLKQGISIHGINVIGTVEKLPDICQKQNIDEIAIALPTATHKELRRVVQVCQGTKIRFRTIPSITDIASGKLKVSQIRDVDINDLLGRDVIHLDLDMIEKFLKNKVILVTGAGGSIGSEMARQVCNFEPKLLLLVEQAENPLFFIERELRKTFPDVAMKALVRNITDKNLFEQVFEEFKPQVVIHAAAHKHVPLMETNPGEAVKNNIIGTKVVAELAGAFKTDDFVMISTDKAVNPTSIMGSTKRIAEMYIQDLNRTSDTHFITVRFGNVLGSNGSVVPIFKNQIARGGPVTVTHPDMKRYFMTIPEASQLVLQAATLGKGGEIFVLDMGEPVKIVELARELITLSGFRPGEDIEIVFTGTRPGEKLFEELSIEGEDMLPTKHPKIAAWKNILADRQTLYAGIEKLLSVAKTQDHQKIVTLIKELVPEYLGNINNST